MPKRRRERVVFHYKIDHDLRPEDRELYHALLRNPKTTVDAAHQWLLARGYALSRSAVARHRRRVLLAAAEAKRQREHFEIYAQLSREQEAKPGGAGGMVRALIVWLEHVVFRRLMAVDEFDVTTGETKELSTDELQTLTQLVHQCLKTRQAQFALEKTEAESANSNHAKPSPAESEPLAVRISRILGGDPPGASQPK